MKMKIIWIVSIGLLLVSLLAFRSPNEPIDYNSCILENMKGVESDKAAILIAKSCRLKFPEPVVYMTEDEAFDKTQKTISPEEWAKTRPGENYFNQFD